MSQVSDEELEGSAQRRRSVSRCGRVSRTCGLPELSSATVLRARATGSQDLLQLSCESDAETRRRDIRFQVSVQRPQTLFPSSASLSHTTNTPMRIASTAIKPATTARSSEDTTADSCKLLHLSQPGERAGASAAKLRCVSQGGSR